jgi:hypothetical protein
MPGASQVKSKISSYSGRKILINLPHQAYLHLDVIVQSASQPGAGQPEPREHWVPVDFTVTCKRCHLPNLAWQHSTRTKKFYLCVTRRTAEDKLEADRRGFHHCPQVPPVKVDDNEIPF